GNADKDIIWLRNEGLRIAGPGQLADRRQEAVGGRQHDAPIIRVLEIEHRSQVPADGAAPRRDVALENAEALLDELDGRGVIENLRVDKTAFGPGRDHEGRHALPQSDRAIWDGGRDDLIMEVNRRRADLGRSRKGLWRRGRNNMVEAAVGFVVVDD